MVVISVDNILDGAPPHSLRKGTFDLTNIDCRVDARTHVDNDIRKECSVIACQNIDFDLRVCNPLCEVVEGVAFP